MAFFNTVNPNLAKAVEIWDSYVNGYKYTELTYFTIRAYQIPDTTNPQPYRPYHPYQIRFHKNLIIVLKKNIFDINKDAGIYGETIKWIGDTEGNIQYILELLNEGYNIDLCTFEQVEEDLRKNPWARCPW